MAPAAPSPAPAHQSGRGPGRRVSQATVSLVLGEKWRGRVSEATAAVRDAARELGYRPELAARSLRLGRTRTALLVVPALTNEFFARVYTGAAPSPPNTASAWCSTPPPRGRARQGPLRLGARRARRRDRLLDGGGRAGRYARRGPAGDARQRPGGAHDAAARSTSTSPTACGRSTEHLPGPRPPPFVHLASAVNTWTFEVRARALAEAVGPSPARVHRWRRPWTSTTGREAAEAALAAPAPADGDRLRRRHPGRRRLQGRPPAGAAGARRRLRHRLRRPRPGHRRGARTHHGAAARRTGGRAAA